jgi:sorting nexin-29
MPDQWKESIIVPIHKTGDKTNCNNYRVISLLSTSYKIFSNILPSLLGPYIDEIIGDHQRGFRLTGQLLIRFFAFVRYWKNVGVQ